MKICILHRYPPGQIKATNAAFPYLRGKGFDVLTFKKFDRLNDRMKFIKSLAWIFYAPMLVAGKRYDVIYCDDSFPFYPIFVKLVSWRSKVIIRLGDFHLMYYCSGFVYKILHAIEKIGWRLADKIFAISKVMADKIREESNHPCVIYIPDPVDPKDFPYLNGAKFDRVMFHGILTRNKNVDVLLDAARILPEVKFWVVGDGPDKERLERLAPYNVIFKGWVPHNQICHYIAKCKVGVALRSNNPGNEYVVTSPFLQYGVMGKPCIVSKRKVFGDYPWQFKNAKELTERIRYLLGHPKEGLKLREYVLKEHDARRIADDISCYLQF